MAKTTIDGLKVRATKTSSGGGTSVRKKPGATMDIKPSKANSRAAVAAVQKKASLNAPRLSSPKHATKPASTKKPRAKTRKMVDDFVQPVEEFMGEDSLDESLGAEVGEDWNDLLDEMNSEEAQEGRKAKSIDPDLEIEEEPKKPGRKQKTNKKGKKKKKHLGLKIFFSLLVIGIAAFLIWGNDLIARLTNGNSGLWDTIWAMVGDEVPFETDENGRTNVLVFGTEGYDMNGSTGNGDVHDGAQLTDSIMIVSFDQETKDVALLSLPRDLKVRAACFAGKVNEIFWCNNPDNNDEEAGAQAMMEEIGEILDIDFQYWAHINWGSLINIIDAIGGITVTLDEDIADYYYTGAVAQAGVPLTVNGEQALGLARARHGTQGGDFTRGNTQQKILEGIIQKVINDGVGVTEVFNILNILGDNFRSNFSSDNFKAGVKLVSDFDINNIRQVPLVDYETETYYVTTAMINEISYVIPSAGQNDYSEIQNYIRKMFSSEPAARENASIAVYNATGETGVAGAEKTKLENSGFTVTTIGDALPEECVESHCVFDLTDSKPATKGLLEQRYDITMHSAAELPADIWPGEVDFVIIIGATETQP